MIFLIEYNRRKGRLVNLEKFADSERRAAEKTRIALELELNRKRIHHEVVLLEAENEEALRRTHRRYFENLRQLAESTT